jgi:RHS repeat-associated protein
VSGGIPLLLGDGTTAYVYGPGGQPLEQVNGATVLWFHRDQLGSTRLVTNSTGVTQATYTYDPHGGLASSTGTITNPFRFAGQYQDVESGFYQLRARYYDPITAQFITTDPLASASPVYVYSENNPLNYKDPTGLIGWVAPYLDARGSTLYWTIIIMEAPRYRPINFTYQFFHDGVRVGGVQEEVTNVYGGSRKTGTLDCLPGHWRLVVNLEGGDSGNAEADCKDPSDSCSPGGVVNLSMGMGAVASSKGCDPGIFPVPFPDIPSPITDPIPLPGVPVGLLSWLC